MQSVQRYALSLLAVFVLSGFLLQGCGGKGPAPRRDAKAPLTKDITIRHLVYFTLENQKEMEELLLDNLEAMAVIPSVADYWCGPAYNTDRPTVVNDFDLVLFVGFKNEKAYRDYLEHPVHLELADKWKPRLTGMATHDVDTKDMELGLDTE
jgi:hypothetical protein